MAYEQAAEGFGPEMSAREIREQASPRLHESLEGSGCPGLDRGLDYRPFFDPKNRAIRPF